MDASKGIHDQGKGKSRSGSRRYGKQIPLERVRKNMSVVDLSVWSSFDRKEVASSSSSFNSAAEERLARTNEGVVNEKD